MAIMEPHQDSAVLGPRQPSNLIRGQNGKPKLYKSREDCQTGYIEGKEARN